MAEKFTGDRPLRVILLAPTWVVGGITTWARVLRKYSDPRRVEYRIIDTSKMFDPLGRPLGVRGAILGVRDMLIRLVALLRTVRSFRPDLVYITCSPNIGLAVRDSVYVQVLRVLGVPAVLHLHGGEPRGFFGTGAFFVRRWVLRATMRAARAVFVITRTIEREGRRFLPGDKVIYVPNMIDDELVAAVPARSIRPAGDPGPFRLLHVAWQAREKGSFDLAEAVAQVKSAVDCNLVGISPPENQEEIQGRIAQLGVQDRIRMVGQKRGKDLEEFFTGADIFVLPTHAEGFPMVIAEAMTYGLPIIASDVGNIREMIGYDTDRPAGLLLENVPPVDPQDLADKIDALIADAGLRQRMSENGPDRIRTCYLASRVVPELEGLLVALSRKRNS